MVESDKRTEIDESDARRLEQDHLRLMNEGDALESEAGNTVRLKPAKEMLRLIEIAREVADVDDQTLKQFLTEHDISTDVDAAKEGLDEASTDRRIGDFEIVRLLGQGGFGLVFLARDVNLDRLVALKVPRPEIVLTPDHQVRFIREAKAAASLSHPNIVPVFEVDRAGTVWYIASQYVEGMTLAEWLKDESNSPSVELSAKLVADLAEALQHAHSRGVLHRDLKPANVLVEVDPERTPTSKNGIHVRVADFGLAKIANDQSNLTQTGAVVGTPSYMSPEQSRGQVAELGPATDVYALGAILYELLTGQPPFKGAGVLETIKAIQSSEPVSLRKLNPDVPRDLEKVCLKCLEKTPGRRYASAYDLQADLENFLVGRPVKARPISTLDRTIKWTRRNPFLAASLTAVLVALIAVSALLIRTQNLLHTAETQRTRANTKAALLTDAIERLFTAVAESPTIHLAEADPLRERLFEEANAMYAELVADEPQDDKMRAEYARSTFQLAKLLDKIGFPGRALELSDNAIEETRSIAPGEEVSKGEYLEWSSFSAERLNDLGRFGEGLHRFDTLFPLIDVNLASLDQRIPSTDDADFEVRLANALTMRARILLESGDLRRAEIAANGAFAYWTRILDLGVCTEDECREQRASCLLVQANLLNSKGQFADAGSRLDAAIESLRPVLSGTPYENLGVKHRFVECMLLKGITEAQQDRLDEARQHYNEAKDVASEIAEYHPRVKTFGEVLCSIRYSLCVTEMLSHNYVEAEDLALANTQTLDAMIERFPEDRVRLLDRMAVNFNILYVVRQRSPDHPIETAQIAIEKAIDILDQVIDAQPSWDKPHMELGRALNNLGNINASQEDYESAIDCYDRAVETLEAIFQQQQDWRIRQSLGIVHQSAINSHVEIGNYEEALDHFDQAVEMFDGRDDVIVTKKARIVANMGDTELARELLTDFLNDQAKTARQFMYVASESMHIHDDLIGDSATGAFAETFKSLAIQSLLEGMPQSIEEKQEYFAAIARVEILEALLPLVSGDSETDQ